MMLLCNLLLHECSTPKTVTGNTPYRNIYEDAVFLEDMAAIEQGWVNALADYGIEAETIGKAFAFRSLEVRHLLNISKQIDTPMDKPETYTATMRELLQNRIGESIS